MNRHVSFFCALLLAFGTSSMCRSAAANAEPILIEKSASPDGRKEIIIVPSDEDTGIAAGTAKIRDVKTHRILWSFEWSGFGVRPDSKAFDVLWSPDSRCFAINWELTRGFVTSAVYAQARHAWCQVKLPDLSKPAVKMTEAAGSSQAIVHDGWGGKGHETAQEWLSNKRLRIEAGYRLIEEIALTGGGDTTQLFWFTFEITGIDHALKPRAVLRKLEFAHASAYPYLSAKPNN